LDNVTEGMDGEFMLMGGGTLTLGSAKWGWRGRRWWGGEEK